MSTVTTEQSNSASDFVWGAKSIATAINLPSARRAFHLMETGQLPGARRIGRRWALDLKAFRAAFRGEVA